MHPHLHALFFSLLNREPLSLSKAAACAIAKLRATCDHYSYLSVDVRQVHVVTREILLSKNYRLYLVQNMMGLPYVYLHAYARLWPHQVPLNSLLNPLPTKDAYTRHKPTF